MGNRAFIPGWKRAAITAAVAYALVLQALLLSFGGAMQAAAAPGPQAFICAPGSESGPGHAPAKAHDGLCCTLSCHGAGSAGPAPALVSFERLAPVAAILETSAEAPVLRLASNVLPLGSRAPPRLG